MKIYRLYAVLLGRGMCYPVSGVMHIKNLAANRKE